MDLSSRSRARHVQVLANLPAGVRGIILTSPAEMAKFTRNPPRSIEAAAADKGLT
jgi:hypothetical protein